MIMTVKRQAKPEKAYLINTSNGKYKKFCLLSAGNPTLYHIAFYFYFYFCTYFAGPIFSDVGNEI